MTTISRLNPKPDSTPLRVGLVMPHIFMHGDILPRVIFSPGRLALDLAEGLRGLGAAVTLFTPGPVATAARNVTADLSGFEAELAARGDGYIDLLKKHPLTFITLARQVQTELLARAFEMANSGELDVVHVYANEEELALPMASLCRKPVVFTHHDPFNFLVKYRSVFSRYRHLNWISLSMAQRRGLPADTNWAGNIYHALDPAALRPNYEPVGNYVAYLGRIVKPKGVHLAIAAIRQYNAAHPGEPLRLKIAGKHYAGAKDSYWQERIQPELGEMIEYVGFIKDENAKQEFLGNARALIMPSLWEEPFGMVMIEALACGTPVVGLNSGAIPEVMRHGETGLVVDKGATEDDTAANLAAALGRIGTISRHACRADFERRFTLERMARQHLELYRRLATRSPAAP